jgi:predicted P-loop ATPase
MDKRLTGLKIEKAKINFNDRIAPIIDFLRDNYDIRINCFDSSKSIIRSKKKNYKYSPTIDDISLHMHSAGIQYNDTLLRKILKSQNEIEKYNPITEYFGRVEKSYCGKSHIDILIGHLTAMNFGDKPKNYYRDRLSYLVKKWLVATAACAMGSYPNPVALGLIHSEEGIGKTFFFNFLLPDEMKDFYVEFIPGKMEMQDLFARKMMILFDEFLGITTRSAELFKNIIQRDNFELRNPHEFWPVNKPRIGSACFTSNQTSEKGGFLIPELGTRRFACIELENIDRAYSKLVDVNQVWAETIILIKGGFDYKFNLDDFKEFKEYNTRYIKEAIPVKIIRMFYEIPLNGEGEWKQPIEIHHDLVRKRRIGKNDKVSIEQIGSVLTQLSFQKKSIRVKGKGSRRAYYVKEVI